MNLFIPGRLCLFGEHSDWAGTYSNINAQIEPGMAIVTGIQEGIYAHVEKSSLFRFRTVCDDNQWREYPLVVASLTEEAKKAKFYSYVAGTVAYMLEKYNVGGLAVDCYEATLPIGKGLSSSAAVCVLIVRAFNQLYDLNMSVSEEMEAAYMGELKTPSRCGRLDQACAYGKGPILMTFCGNELQVTPIEVGADLHWVVIQLDGAKDTTRILADLHSCYPFAQDDAACNLHYALGEYNKRIVHDVIEAIGKGDAIQIGRLMNESQRIFNSHILPISPEALSSPKFHAFINDTEVIQLSLGAKGVGSHGDGCAQFICKDSHCQDALVERAYNLGYVGSKVTLFANKPDGSMS